MANLNQPWTEYDYLTGLSARMYHDNDAPANYFDQVTELGNAFCKIRYRRIYGHMNWHLTFRWGSTTALPHALGWGWQFPEDMYDIMRIIDDYPAHFFTPSYFTPVVYTDASGNRYIGQSLMNAASSVSGQSVFLCGCDRGAGAVLGVASERHPFNWATGAQLDVGNTLPVLDS